MDLFNYTPEQHYNIHRRQHPDCCQADPCGFCGASEAVGGGGCAGDLKGLPLDLFQAASCAARNANVKSIGQFVNWKIHDENARLFDAAARALATPTSAGSPAAASPASLDRVPPASGIEAPDGLPSGLEI